MATKQQEELAALLLAGGISAHAVSDIISRGRLTRAETGLLMKIFRKVLPFAGRQALRMGGTAAGVARAHPVLTAGAIAYIAHKQGVSLDTARAIAVQEYEASRRQPQFFLEEQLKERISDIELAPAPPAELFVGREGVAFGKAVKRKVTRANTAVKQGMKWLKEGTKAATGSVPGVLPAQAFRTTVKAAGMANPKTKSKPGKGKSIMNKLARRLKKWW